MPFPVVCPKCKADYQVPDHLLGKPIGCRKCDFLFRAAPPGPQSPLAARPTSSTPRQASSASESAATAVVASEPQLEVVEENRASRHAIGADYPGRCR